MRELLFEGKLKIDIPDIYEEIKTLQNSMVLVGAPANKIYQDKTYGTVLTISYHDNIEINSDSVVGRTAFLRYAYSKIEAGYKPGECLTKIIGNHRLGILTFYSEKEGKNIYNMVGVTNCCGREVMVTYYSDVMNSYRTSGKILKMLERMIVEGE